MYTHKQQIIHETSADTYIRERSLDCKEMCI